MTFNGDSSSGRTPDSESGNDGSNPSSPANPNLGNLHTVKEDRFPSILRKLSPLGGHHVSYP